MSPIDVELEYDSDGYPSRAKITKNKRVLTVTFERGVGFKLHGQGLPSIAEILKLIYPAEKEVTFNIPDPLNVVTIPGGGRVLLNDDMEGLLKWKQTVGGTVSLDNTRALNGSQSLKLVCGAADTSCQAERYFAFPKSGKLKVSYNFMVDDYAKLDYFCFALFQERLTNSFQGGIHFHRPSLAWQIYVAGAYVTILTIPNIYPNAGVAGPWNHVEAYFDFSSRFYKKLIANEHDAEFGVSQSLHSYSAAVYDNRIAFAVDNTAGQEVSGWIDDFSLTEYK